MDQKARWAELELSLARHKEATAAKRAFAKALLAQFDVRLHNPAYAYLQVTYFRQWNIPIVLSKYYGLCLGLSHARAVLFITFTFWVLGFGFWAVLALILTFAFTSDGCAGGRVRSGIGRPVVCLFGI